MSLQQSLLSRMRNAIDAPDALTKSEFCALLQDAGEAIIMLQRVVAKYAVEPRVTLSRSHHDR